MSRCLIICFSRRLIAHSAITCMAMTPVCRGVLWLNTWGLPTRPPRRGGYAANSHAYTLSASSNTVNATATPLWKTTADGAKQLARARRKRENLKLPESPQHRRWRSAR